MNIASLEEGIDHSRPIGRSPHLMMMPEYYSEEEVLAIADTILKAGSDAGLSSVRQLVVSDDPASQRGDRSVSVDIDGRQIVLNENGQIDEALLSELGQSVWMVKFADDVSPRTLTSLLFFIRERIANGTFLLIQKPGVKDEGLKRSSLEALVAMKMQVHARITRLLLENTSSGDNAESPEGPTALNRAEIRRLNNFLIHDDPAYLLAFCRRLVAEGSTDLEETGAIILSDFLRRSVAESRAENVRRALMHLSQAGCSYGVIEGDTNVREGFQELAQLGLIVVKGEDFSSNSKIISELSKNQKLSERFFTYF